MTVETSLQRAALCLFRELIIEFCRGLPPILPCEAGEGGTMRSMVEGAREAMPNPKQSH